MLLSDSSTAQDPPKRTIAILDFNNNSIVDRERLEPLRKGLADILITEISKIGAFRVVERDKLREVVMELEFGQSELVDPSTAQEMGKLLGAQNLLFGGYVYSYGDNIRVDVRIVEVETGRTIKAVEERGDLDDLFDIVEELSAVITDFFDIELTEADRQRQSERSSTESFDATLAYSKSIDFEDLAMDFERQGKADEAKAMYEKALEMLEKAIVESPEFTDAATKAESIRAHLKRL
jgi:TolB-like protein